MKKTILLLMILALALVSACSTSENTNNNPNNTKNPNNNEGQNDDAGNEADQHQNEKFVIDYFRLGPALNEPDISENPIKQQIEEDMNIEYQVSAIPGWGDFTQQFSARVVAGDLPDIVMVRKSDLARFVEQGAIISLEELINEMPELRDSRTEEEWLYGTVDGEIYGIPNISRYGRTFSTYVRQDWLDNLGLDLPETFDEFTHMLERFTYGDPDDNGKNDTYGISVPGINNWGFIQNAFGLRKMESNGVPNDWIDENGNFISGATSDEFRNFLTYLNELDELGVLDPDIPTNSTSRLWEKSIQGQIGVAPISNPHNVIFEGKPHVYEPAKQVNPDAEWVYLPPIKGPEGHWGNDASTSTAASVVAVTKNVLEEPGKAERVIQLINYMDNRENFDKGAELLNYGIEGVHHEKSDDTINILPERSEAAQDYLGRYYLGGVQPNEANFMIDQAELYEQIHYDKQEGYTVVSDFYSSMPFAYDGDKYVEEMYLKFLYGEEDLSNWDEYVNTLNERYRYNELQEHRMNELREIGLID